MDPVDGFGVWRHPGAQLRALLKACGLARRHFCAPVTAKGSSFQPETHGRMVSGQYGGARYLVAVAGQEAQQCSSDPVVRQAAILHVQHQYIQYLFLVSLLPRQMPVFGT